MPNAVSRCTNFFRFHLCFNMSGGRKAFGGLAVSARWLFSTCTLGSIGLERSRSSALAVRAAARLDGPGIAPRPKARRRTAFAGGDAPRPASVCFDLPGHYNTINSSTWVGRGSSVESEESSNQARPTSVPINRYF